MAEISWRGTSGEWTDMVVGTRVIGAYKYQHGFCEWSSMFFLPNDHNDELDAHLPQSMTEDDVREYMRLKYILLGREHGHG